MKYQFYVHFFDCVITIWNGTIVKNIISPVTDDDFKIL